MAKNANPLRWLILAMLGCALGLLVVFAGLYHAAMQERENLPFQHITRRSPEPPVRLSDESVRNELIQVIQSQLAAFRKDDYPRAYNYAASSIHDQVPLPAFERMVRTGFPVIARSTAAEFGIVLDNGRDAVVSVGIVGDSGKIISYRYQLRFERSEWKISGVVRVPKSEGTFI